ncbi:putative exported protein [Minicystis rosea]|nr:putative exported protein [Minicystis rosea]
MDAPRLDNKTDLAAAPRTLMAKDGERLVLIVKATCARVPGTSELEFVPRAERRGIRGQDIPWGDPEKSSIKYPSDLCIAKPGTDVIVVASAHAPGGKAVPSFDAGVRIGPLEKTIRVFGLRVWAANGSSLTAPQPTAGVEVRYDYAWGGLDVSDPERLVEEPRNPAGMGVVRDLATLTHKPAPMIEDPANLMASVRTSPPPAGLGAIGRHWEPRRSFLGTYDASWLKERAPLLPLDHDDRANLCASPGLTAVPPLVGGEDVALLNLTPEVKRSRSACRGSASARPCTQRDASPRRGFLISTRS